MKKRNGVMGAGRYLSRSPYEGDVLHVYADNGETWIWESSVHPGFFHLMTLFSTGSMETFRRPMKWWMLRHALRELRCLVNSEILDDARPQLEKMWSEETASAPKFREPYCSL